jgi:hypothetical protein
VADTFSSMYNGLRLWAPDVPIFLAQQMIRDRYRRIAERRIWSDLRGEGEFIINDAKTAGTVTMTRESATVTGSGTAFAASDVGRQFMVGNRAPVYSVSAVGGATSLTLDRVFGDETDGPGLSYRILDAYVTCPSDFQHFIVVYDPKQNWRLRHFVTQDDVSRYDPARTSAGTPWALIDRRRSTLAATAGRAQFELWPYSVSERNYPFYYRQVVADLVDDSDTTIQSIRGDAVVIGARADLTMWPGSVERPNPMYDKSGAAYRVWEAQFQDQVAELERADENTFMTWLSDQEWTSWPHAPLDARFLQNHAF